MMSETPEELGECDSTPFELEGQMVLRLPPDRAAHLRELLKSGVKNLHKRFRIDIKEGMREGTAKLDDATLPAKIYDLPTIIECHKTFDRKIFYKVADICQMMVCTEIENKDEEESENEQNSSPNGYLDRDGRDKRYLYPHGVTQCLKNVRKRRFRKMRRKKFVETPTVEKEVMMLLRTDNEAYSHRFELVNPDDEKPKSKESKADILEHQPVRECDIFGEVSSSEDSNDEEDVEKKDVDLLNITNRSSENFDDDNKNSEKLSDSIINVETVAEETQHEDDLSSQLESETAEENLGEILRGQKTEREKEELCNKLHELELDIAHLRGQRRLQEIDVESIGNQALKERFQRNIDHLKAKEAYMQTEYNEIANMLLIT